MKTIVNFWLDATLLSVFLLILWISTIVRFVFPPAADAGDVALWNRNYQWWLDLQFGLLALFAFGVLMHVMLHWNWLCGVLAGRIMRRSDGKKRVINYGMRTIYGVGLMIVILNVMGLGIAAAVLFLQEPM